MRFFKCDDGSMIDIDEIVAVGGPNADLCCVYFRSVTALFDIGRLGETKIEPGCMYITPADYDRLLVTMRTYGLIVSE